MKTIRVFFADNTTEVYDFNENILKAFIDRANSGTLIKAWQVIKIELE